MTLAKHFEEIGARVVVRDAEAATRNFVQRPLATPAERAAARRGLFGGRQRPWQRGPEPFALDVKRDRRGEYFEVVVPKDSSVEVQHKVPADRHLLLLVRTDGRKAKYLCGHDERHWFAAAIPESAPVGTVHQAKEALQPVAVRERAVALPRKERLARHNTAYMRQGEWFFTPLDAEADSAVDPKMIMREEPLTRGRGKPHVAQYLYRWGGETVYVGGTTWTGSRLTPRTLSQAEFDALSERERKLHWRVMRRDAEVLVKGTIRHPDHATLLLQGWHRVVPNTEQQALAMRQLAFLD